MKIKLHTNAKNGGPFNCRPAGEWELEPSEILCNDITLPWERGSALYIIGNEFGAIGAAWATNAQDALDALCDAGLTGGLSAPDLGDDDDADEYHDRYVPLGNHGIPHDLTYCWIAVQDWDVARDVQLIAKFAEARGMGAETLWDGRLS